MSSLHDQLASLNPPQREAATHIDGALLILAGAGSGKTRVLTHRIAYMLDQGVHPGSILAVTFTNKAAAEMKHRVAELVGDVARRMLVTTFHSACVRFLRRDAPKLGWPSSFAIYDTDDQKRLIKLIMGELGVTGKDWTPRRLRSEIDQAKNRMVTPEDLAAQNRRDPGNPVARVYMAYQASLKKAGAVDFNDLLNHIVTLWKEHPDVLARYQRRFQYLMVDEYQDTNKAQYELLRLLMARPAGQPRNVAVVGDDDQSIYAFRGADVRNILDFERDFPDAKVVRLEQNYRSTGNILAAAHSVVKHNGGRMDKQLWTDKGAGAPIKLLTCQDDSAEAEAVVGELRTLVRSGRYRWGDCAVIYRTNAASRSFEQVLTRAGVPHILVGARKFYERKEVRDILGYLKLVLNPVDDMAVLRIINVPRRGVGAKSLLEIQAIAENKGVPLLDAARHWSKGRGKARAAVSKLCKQLDQWAVDATELEAGKLVARIVEQSGYADALRADGSDESRGRLENLDALAQAVEEPFDEAQDFDDLYVEEAQIDLSDPLIRLQAFMDKVTLAGQDEDLPDAEDQGKVTLLTAHLAKGLEFPVVYVVGMYEGGFPHFRSLEREEDLDEERRLVYVAFTRAKELLALSRPQRRRRLQGDWGPVNPSPFLGYLPADVVEHEVASLGQSPHNMRYAARQRERATYRAPAGLGRTERTPSTPARPRQGALFAGASPSAQDTSAEDSGPVTTITPEHPDQLAKGTEVMHPTLGRGTIQECSGSPANLKLTVHFRKHGRKKLMLRHANLEIVVG